MPDESRLTHAPLKHRIALIACYFGPLPSYASLVFHSAAHNPSLDWLIFSDQKPEFQLPPNVRFIPSELKEVEREMQRTCETPVSIDGVYDLTRLKPTYGLCFAKYLTDYDFWGHVDLDMIYGDLRAFLPEEVLDCHARIYCRGHLSIFRNTPEVNRLFMLNAPGAPCYREVLANRDRHQFDEWDGIWKIFRYHRIKQYHAEVIADIHPPTPYKTLRFDTTELPNHPQQVFYWHQGKTYQAYYHQEGGLFDREVAYVHFQKRRLTAPTFDPSEVNGFTIGPLGFAPYDRENLTMDEMEVLNPTKWKSFAEIRQYWTMGFRRKINKLGTALLPGKSS